MQPTLRTVVTPPVEPPSPTPPPPPTDWMSAVDDGTPQWKGRQWPPQWNLNPALWQNPATDVPTAEAALHGQPQGTPPGNTVVVPPQDAAEQVTPMTARKRFEKYAALEARVTALEAALARCPGEACPFCGARAWRFKDVQMQGIMEVWQCGECQKERDYRYDLAGQLPPGANPNRNVKPRR